MAVIVANPLMIDAYRAGIPDNGKPFPDGSKIAKIHWKPTKSAEAPAPTTVPGTLDDVDFIERDSKRFPNTGGWGYAQFDYNETYYTFAPPREWLRLRVRVPYDSGFQRLHLHRVPEALSMCSIVNAADCSSSAHDARGAVR